MWQYKEVQQSTILLGKLTTVLNIRPSGFYLFGLPVLALRPCIKQLASTLNKKYCGASLKKRCFKCLRVQVKQSALKKSVSTLIRAYTLDRIQRTK